MLAAMAGLGALVYRALRPDEANDAGGGIAASEEVATAFFVSLAALDIEENERAAPTSSNAPSPWSRANPRCGPT